ncbi:MAG: Gfo/Idh/MocA family oxidoreductase [Acidobacteriaceae bacterium]|nr:Gfo/Idh/MocA family oxidoreductase [Acidobacteriaceae bacterium]
MHRGGLVWSRQALDGQPTWRGSVKLTGGGCFIQLAVHYIHVFEWLIGERVRRVIAITKNTQCPGIEGEDLTSAILEFESGILATLDMAWNTAGEQLSIHGTRGSVQYLNSRWLFLESNIGAFRGRVVDFKESTEASSKGMGSPAQTIEVVPPEWGDFSNPLNQHRQFLEAVRDSRPPFVSIASGIDDLRVIAGVYESASTGLIVALGAPVMQSA